MWAAKWSVRSAWDYATELVANTINSTQSNGGFPGIYIVTPHKHTSTHKFLLTFFFVEYVGPLGARPTTPKQRSPFDTNDNDNQGENSSGFVDITVLRSNWYGRHQKRIYRFYTNYFDRVDPQGTTHIGKNFSPSFRIRLVSSMFVQTPSYLSFFL